MKTVFLSCNEIWTETGFIFGAGYKSKNAAKWQLLNFVVGQAKLSIYKSRKNQIDNGSGTNALHLFIALVKARVKVDFRFFSMMKDLDEFISKWCCVTAICDVFEGGLVFNSVFA